MKGVEGVKVDFAAKTVQVSCGEGTDSAALIAALEGAGFGGSIED